MKEQDPLTQLLGTRLTDKQVALIRLLLKLRPSERLVENSSHAMRSAVYARRDRLNREYQTDPVLVKAKAEMLEASNRYASLERAKQVIVDGEIERQFTTLEALLRGAMMGKLTTEHFKEAVDAFCKETNAP